MPSSESLGFHQLHRLGRTNLLWVLLGVLVLGSLVAVGAQLVLLPVFVIASALGVSIETDPVSPAGLAWVNLVWAVAIPFAFLIARVVHRIPRGWVTSVAGRVRWRWFVTCLGLAAAALTVTVVVAAYLPRQETAPVGGTLNDVTSETAAFMVVVVLLTPLQAAGEEYVFRGYLTQAFGGLVAGRLGILLAVVVPAVVFALAHGAQDPPVFVDRLAFGLVAGVLVIVTGGLEAAVAMHVLNNWLAFALALAFGDMNSALHPTSSGWATLPTTLVQSLTFVALTVWVARRRGLGTRTGEPVLEPPNGRV
ncbi:CPBP family intramembrane metalloprotease [Nocardioides panacisoli]|uniref:CPBP family intramembrane glutamic endopeptidase n=1 Tax=Nocardioides panacisoli TaxID=627624 RepID=UPI001C627F93|nr:type II CAAX endopeptidase family protein [Nocardioides panacisoli]QYJ04513.1 CPBP family intramembrane metalloprotease [Nocardioides panacisoli]